VSRYNATDYSSDSAHAIAVGPDGNIYVTGGSYASARKQEFATIAYNSSGNELWIERYDGTGYGDDFAMDILVDSTRNVYVTGPSMMKGSNHDFCTIKYSQEKEDEILEASIDIDPDTFNLNSKGRWITAYIDLPIDYDVNDILIDPIMLEDAIPAEWGDAQNDTLMVKFDRSDVEDLLIPGAYHLKVTGELTGGKIFEGYSDEIRVIQPPKHK